MPTAEDLFTQTFVRFFRNWSFITALRQVGDVALPIAEQALGDIHTDFIERMSVDPNYKNVIVKLDGSETSWGDGVKNMLQREMTKGTIASARAAIDAASLVFAQSVLDDCALSYLRVCALANPGDWDPFFAEKKVAYSSVGKPAEEIREMLIADKLERLEWESLLTKVDLLFQLCKPPKDYAPMNNYKFDRERLAKIDDARHGIIHRNAMAQPLADIDADLEYVLKTANFLMGLVNQRYGVQLNSEKMYPPSPTSQSGS
jgi:hypothetical protein